VGSRGGGGGRRVKLSFLFGLLSFWEALREGTLGGWRMESNVVVFVGGLKRLEMYACEGEKDCMWEF
jgi:hypothetical protein